MPHFYFNTADGGREEDRNGVSLASANVAQNTGVRFLAERVLEDPALALESSGFRVEILDEHRALLTTIRMRVDDAPSNDNQTPSRS